MKKKLNTCKPLDEMPASVYYLGDMLAGKLNNRTQSGYLPTGTDDDIIRYTGDNTNCWKNSKNC